ncbi:aldose 1-epimerase [Novosphingobium sp. TH158]|uniref:aldose 1-epimerase n=1 Tax=Novosphingobium sp. TH158 TaxID=2067455 RepID=UPI0013043956|nr:aldose 1-epimerase [Novosphingobium sp. TH158]
MQTLVTGLIELGNAACRLVLDPDRGGSIVAFEWNGNAVMRQACGPGVLDAACFPLVPFSNRIAQGRFTFEGKEITIAPNFPGTGNQPHPMHGFGWLANWTVAQSAPDRAVLAHEYDGGEWPGPYHAEQVFTLLPQGLEVELAVTALGNDPMPAGLGFHPYFPRDADTVYHGLHRGEWQTGNDGLPRSLLLKDRAVDWWHGQPVGGRTVDMVYTMREGMLRISWPSRGMAVTIDPDPLLSCTTVYVPEGETFFCVEPVSHRTDAINARGLDRMRVLQPGETLKAGMRLRIQPLAAS